MPDSEYAGALTSDHLDRPTGLKRLLPRTLFGRSLLIIVTPVVLAQLVATWIFYDRHWETVTRRLAFGVAGDIALVIDQLNRFPDPTSQSQILEAAASTTDLVITLEPGARLPALTGPLNGRLERTLAAALEEQVARPFAINTRIAHEWYEIRIQMPDGLVRVLSPERRMFSPTTYIFILWMTGSALVCLPSPSCSCATRSARSGGWPSPPTASAKAATPPISNPKAPPRSVRRPRPSW